MLSWFTCFDVKSFVKVCKGLSLQMCSIPDFGLSEGKSRPSSICTVLSEILLVIPEREDGRTTSLFFYFYFFRNLVHLKHYLFKYKFLYQYQSKFQSDNFNRWGILKPLFPPQPNFNSFTLLCAK
jgi:hypothetical protein